LEQLTRIGHTLKPHFEATPPGIEGTTNSGSPIPAEDDAITTVLAAHGVDSPLP